MCHTLEIIVPYWKSLQVNIISLCRKKKFKTSYKTQRKKILGRHQKDFEDITHKMMLTKKDYMGILIWILLGNFTFL